ncbi:MAG: hypothetical protein J7513_06110 [Solirubrobacteraceae bacterium]|nr:hypothetical protein [Solirubrobacteraceae bacterium]
MAAIGLAACGSGESGRAASDGQDDLSALEAQLAENREGLPDEAPSAEKVKPRSVLEAVRDDQQLGFFAGQDPTDVAAVAERTYRRDWGKPLKIATRYDELELLRNDRDRVWFQDIEADVLEGNESYALVFQEWARISRGAFKPSNVRERWSGENDPVEISFDLAGQRHTVQAQPQGDFYDLCVLTGGINPVIKASGKHFALWGPDADLGQEAFVVVLTEREQYELEQAGWSFATGDEMRAAFGYGQTSELGDAAPCA